MSSNTQGSDGLRRRRRQILLAVLVATYPLHSVAFGRTNWFTFEVMTGGPALNPIFIEAPKEPPAVWRPGAYARLALKGETASSIPNGAVERRPEGATLDPSGRPNDEASATKAGSDETQEYGAKPEDVRSVFLRQSSSLLKEGRVQWDIGVTYATQQSRGLAVLPDGSVDLAKLKTRQIAAPITWRRGIYDCLEFFSTVPVGISNYELTDAGRDESSTLGGVGDVGAGFLYQALYETPDCPDVILSLSSTAPSGASPFGPSPDFATLGRGFWTVSTGVSWVKSYDPIVLYGGIGYRHEFEREFDGVAVIPAEAFNFSYGLGFAVSDDIALTAEVVAERQASYRLNGRKALGSANEPVALKLGLTRRTEKDRTIQPFVSIGLTDDAPQVFAGIYFVSERQAWFSIK